jgi:methylenetetrahydrofolate dehydrogenase (NADP+)/methenyltetrahydrofolate cyclohydrolase
MEAGMAALVLDGRPPAREIEAQLAARVAALRERNGGRSPVLAILLVGTDRTSARHAQMKESACRRVGIEPLPIHLPEQATTAEVLARIDGLNADPRVDGIFLQHPAGAASRGHAGTPGRSAGAASRGHAGTPGSPVAEHVDERRCFDRIALEKDVGGDASQSFGRLATGESGFASVTPAGIMRLLSYYGVALEGKRAVVVGRSPMVGKPMAILLLGAHATVTLCHSRTGDLPEVVRRGEVVVGAVGRPELIRGRWIRDGAVVIDAGYHRGGVGDVELPAAADRCFAYTPVPGGVGPMTIATLLAHTVEAAERSAGTVRTGPPPCRPR